MFTGGNCRPGPSAGKHQIPSTKFQTMFKAPKAAKFQTWPSRFEFAPSDLVLGASDFSDRARWLSKCDIVRRGLGLRQKVGSFRDFPKRQVRASPESARTDGAD